ncbi:MAG: hypothetical protein LQ338_004445 [Usnochroma carphineum]|nr:MAG: hypothetical protein LQ338_004445 [Usnochroma carphineum]
MNFGQRCGFMEEGRDIRGIIRGNDNGFRIGALIGQVPWINEFLLENKLLMKMLASTAGIVDPTADFVELIKEKIAEAEAGQPSERCLLAWLRNEQQNSDKKTLDEASLTIHLANYFVAGSVTTATSIGAVIYHTIKNPETYKRLVAEIREQKSVSENLKKAAYKDVQQLPYLQAVIKEAMRLAPTNNLPLERVVTSESLLINDYELPPGTIVGSSAYVVHRNQDIYGTDAGEYRPARWLDTDTARIRKMRKHFFAVSIFTFQRASPPFVFPPQMFCPAKVTFYII